MNELHRIETGLNEFSVSKELGVTFVVVAGAMQRKNRHKKVF